MPFGIGLGTTSDSVDTIGAIFHAFGAVLVDAKGEIVGQERPGPPGARLLQEADGVPAGRRAGVGRRLQQQVAGVGPGRVDHEPAAAPGRSPSATRRRSPSSAGRTASRPGPKGRFGPFLPFFWGTWSFSKNQSAAKSLLDVPLAGRVGREDGDRQRRLRPAVVREAHDLQDVGRGRAAEGHALPLPEPAQSPDALGRRGARAAQDRRADLQPGHPTQMAVRYYKGEAMDKTLDWAAKEIEGFMRN